MSDKFPRPANSCTVVPRNLCNHEEKNFLISHFRQRWCGSSREQQLPAEVTIFDTILLEMTVPLVDAVLMSFAAMEVTATKDGWIFETLATCDRKMP